MEKADAAQVATLAAELGYPLSAHIIEARFNTIADRHRDHATFVAAIGDALQGWTHVYGVHSLAGEAYAEVSALVVAAAVRRRGTGRALMLAAETWARTIVESTI